MTGERSNYVEMLEAEVRRLQAEVTRLTRREDAGDSAIIGELVAALELAGATIDRLAPETYAFDSCGGTRSVIRSALAKVGS